MVLKRDYDPSNLDLASQLEELTVHEGRGHGLSFAGDDARWLYNHPTERLEVHISANSGDIILLANARYGYQFGAPNRGQHGSLTYADSLVPVAFAFPRAMTGDTTLEPIVSLLKSLQTETVAGFTVVQQLIEAAALRAFFFRPQRVWSRGQHPESS